MLFAWQNISARTICASHMSCTRVRASHVKDENKNHARAGHTYHLEVVRGDGLGEKVVLDDSVEQLTARAVLHHQELFAVPRIVVAAGDQS